MPNRIIKESICESETIAKLSDFEFRLWVGLITQADDAGRGDARPAIIKGRVFPLRERVTVSDIEKSLHGLAAKGCISLYEVGGKSYFWFPTWDKHQRVREVKPKYPSPEEAEKKTHDADICGRLRRVAADCGELRQTAADCGLNPNTNPNPNPNPERERARFSPPDILAVRKYWDENKLNGNPEQFCAYYTSNGWMVGKNRMKDWHAAARSWSMRDADKSAHAVKAVEAQQYTQRSYQHTDDAMDAMMAEHMAKGGDA
ncbi:MAG: hypothetical protein ACI4WX_00620 [Aristaeellaceae bacterium]